MIEALSGKTIGVVLGGRSREREVSLTSGETVYQSLIRLGYKVKKIDPKDATLSDYDCDLAFITLHGQYGEDGVIQGLFETLRIPYIGSGVTPSSVCIDKRITKKILLSEGLPTPRFHYLHAIEDAQDICWEGPMIIKPLKEGSSIGIQILETKEDLLHVLPSHIATYGELILEDYIEGIEITASIIEVDKNPVVLPLLELRPKNKFYDYEAKYTEGKTTFIIPATLDSSETDRATALAINTFNLLGCRGMARIDMIVHPKKGPFILEVNTIPGMTPLSDLPAQAEAHGYSYDALVDLLLASAL